MRLHFFLLTLTPVLDQTCAVERFSSAAPATGGSRGSPAEPGKDSAVWRRLQRVFDRPAVSDVPGIPL